MRNLKIAGLTAAALLGSSMLVGTAGAMPLNGLPQASQQVTANVQDVRWVCGPYRCWWQPGPVWRPLYGFWGPRPYWGWHRWGWGWHRRWW